MTKAIKATGTKKEDAKATLRKEIATAAMAGLVTLDGAVVAALTDSMSEVLVRTADYDVVLTFTVKKERLAVEFEADEEVDNTEVAAGTRSTDAEYQMTRD